MRRNRVNRNERKYSAMNRYSKPLYEADDEEEIEIIDDEIEDVEETLIEDQLAEIGDNLGYPFTSHNGSGSFSISDSVEVSIRFTPTEITAIDVRILKNPARFSCTRNTTTVDNLSVELQTCVMIVKDIRSKVKIRG